MWGVYLYLRYLSCQYDYSTKNGQTPPPTQTTPHPPGQPPPPDKTSPDKTSPDKKLLVKASKAFDKINYFKLFRKLHDRKTPIVIVRILLFWYFKQTVCIKWGRCIFFLYLTVLGRVEFYHRNYFWFTLVIFLIT